jgi:hypothetical protein
MLADCSSSVWAGSRKADIAVLPARDRGGYEQDLVIGRLISSNVRVATRDMTVLG